jgi:hypothetical protein
MSKHTKGRYVSPVHAGLEHYTKTQETYVNNVRMGEWM